MDISVPTLTSEKQDPKKTGTTRKPTFGVISHPPYIFEKTKLGVTVCKKCEQIIHDAELIRCFICKRPFHIDCITSGAFSRDVAAITKKKNSVEYICFICRESKDPFVPASTIKVPEDQVSVDELKRPSVSNYF